MISAPCTPSGPPLAHQTSEVVQKKKMGLCDMFRESAAVSRSAQNYANSLPVMYVLAVLD